MNHKKVLCPNQAEDFWKEDEATITFSSLLRAL